VDIGVPKETHHGECRVALTPETAKHIQKLGHSLKIESGAGLLASITDDAYREAGVDVISDTNTLYQQSDLIIKVRAPGKHPSLGDEVALLKEGSALACFVWPAQNEGLMKQLADRKLTVLAMDSVPRISRAQKLDFLPVRLPLLEKCRRPKSWSSVQGLPDSPQLVRPKVWALLSEHLTRGQK